MRFTVQALPLDQTDRVCSLFEKVYGHSIGQQHWNWKYHEGPRMGSVNMTALDIDGEWIGHVGASVFTGWDGTEELGMAQISDIMVRSEARGGLGADSVYPSLVRSVQESLAAQFGKVFAYGFPGLRPFRLGARLGFYRSLYRCRSFTAATNWTPPFRARLWSANRCDDWDPERLDRIWAAVGRVKPSLRVVRSGAYLKWRYRDHPDRTYRLWMLKRLFSDMGWLITSVDADGCVRVVDALFQSPESSTEAVAALIRSLIDEDNKIPELRTWMQFQGASAQDTPIVATEFKVGAWFNEGATASFHPGDTDVY